MWTGASRNASILTPVQKKMDQQRSSDGYWLLATCKEQEARQWHKHATPRRRHSIVPKYHTCGTTVNLLWNEVGAMKRSVDTKRGTEEKENERSAGPIRRNGSEWHAVGRNGWGKGGGEALLRWRTSERMEDKNALMKKEHGDLPVGAPLFNPFPLTFIALVGDLFLEKPKPPWHLCHQCDSAVHTICIYVSIMLWS